MDGAVFGLYIKITNVYMSNAIFYYFDPVCEYHIDEKIIKYKYKILVQKQFNM